MKDDGGIIRKEELFCAIVCSLYCCAGVALFVTGKAPVITESTDFFGDTFAYVWAGWCASPQAQWRPLPPRSHARSPRLRKFSGVSLSWDDVRQVISHHCCFHNQSTHVAILILQT